MVEADWYYTSGNDRVGPVPFSQLKEVARSGEIDPRRDLVWSRGMTDWVVAGEVDGLFSRRAVTTTTLVSKEEEPEVRSRSRQVQNWRGSTPSTTARMGYFIGTVISPVVLTVAIYYAVSYLGPQMPKGFEPAPMVLFLIVPVMFIATIVSRLRNLGMSGWWILGFLIPGLNLWLGYRCFSCPSDYAIAKRMDGAGTTLALIYWLLIAISVASPFVATKMAENNPAMKAKLEELKKWDKEHLSIPWEVKDGAKPAARPVQ